MARTPRTHARRPAPAAAPAPHTPPTPAAAPIAAAPVAAPRTRRAATPRATAAAASTPTTSTGWRPTSGEGLTALAFAIVVCVGLYGFGHDWFTSSAATPPRQLQTQQQTAPAPVAKAAPVDLAGKRAEQQRLCNEQAQKRRDLGIPSSVVWDNPNTCRATGGMVEANKI